ncbi:DUF1707 domain-containing protein [Nocardia sp. NPDC057353]|uniref:DUF1707 domain-containing protein n=1 Tax=Nocardia sp. NPDC057353 TaxID=3346104 RepID=UPI00362F3AEF
MSKNQDDMATRIGNAERESAMALLNEHVAAGRIDVSEFDSRAQRVFSAVTKGDLAAIFADLQAPQKAGPNRWQLAAIGLAVVCVALTVAVVVATTRPTASEPVAATTPVSTTPRIPAPSTTGMATSTTVSSTTASTTTSSSASATVSGSNTAPVQYLMDAEILSDKAYWNFSEGPAAVSGTQYSRSIMLEPRAKSVGYVEYDLGRKFTQLDAVLGVRDDAIPSDIAMQIQIYADGVVVSDTTVKLGAPVPIHLTFDKPLRLRLQATYLTEDADGFAVFGDLRVTR